MICEKCGKNEATIHYSEIINGKKRSYALCRDCADEMGVGDIPTPSFGFGTDSLLSTFFGDMFPTLTQDRRRTQTPERRCPVCGASLSDIASDGKVGCSECYRTFREELMPTIRRIHGSAVYKGENGEKPEKAAEGKSQAAEGMRETPSEPRSEADALRAELYEAIKNEDFERAAVLRDKIKALGAN